MALQHNQGLIKFVNGSFGSAWTSLTKDSNTLYFVKHDASGAGGVFLGSNLISSSVVNAAVSGDVLTITKLNAAGTGKEVVTFSVSDLKSRLNSIESSIGKIESSIGTLATNLAYAEADIDTLEGILQTNHTETSNKLTAMDASINTLENDIIKGIKLNGSVLSKDSSHIVDLGSIATSTAVENAMAEAKKHAVVQQGTGNLYVGVTQTGTTSDGGKIYIVNDSSLRTKISNIDSSVLSAHQKADQAQGEVDALETYVGTIPAGATSTSIVNYITEVANNTATTIGADISDLSTRVQHAEASIGILNSDSTVTGSVANTVATEIAKVVAGAPASFDTLKEIADWIANDASGAAKMANDIATLKGGENTVGSVANTVKNAKDIIDAYTVNGYAISTNPYLDGRNLYVDASAATQVTIKAAIESLQAAVGDGGSVTSQIVSKINELDANVDALNMGVSTPNGGVVVLQKVDQIDGSIRQSSSRAVEVEAAGAAAAAKTEIIGDASSSYNTLGKLQTAITTLNSAAVKSVNTKTPNASGAVTVTGADINLTGYTIASEPATVAATDTVNAAIGKIESSLQWSTFS